MVALLRMVVDLISHARHRFEGLPEWASRIEDKIDSLNKKVNLIMAIDLTVVNRILVGAKFLADREKQNQATIADMRSQRDAALDAARQAGADLSALQAKDAAEDASDAQANAAASQVADEVDALVAGDQTPAVEVPSDPSDVVDVVTGTTDPVVTDPGPTSVPGADGPQTSDSTSSDPGSATTDEVGGSLDSSSER